MRSDSPTSTERRISAWVCSAAGTAQLSAPRGAVPASPLASRARARRPRRAPARRASAPRRAGTRGRADRRRARRPSASPARRPSPSSEQQHAPPSTTASSADAHAPAPQPRPRRRPRARPTIRITASLRVEPERVGDRAHEPAHEAVGLRVERARLEPLEVAARDLGARRRARRARCRAARAGRPGSGRSRTDRPALRPRRPLHRARIAPPRGEGTPAGPQCRRLRYSCDFFAHWLSGARATDVVRWPIASRRLPSAT